MCYIMNHDEENIMANAYFSPSLIGVIHCVMGLTADSSRVVCSMSLSVMLIGVTAWLFGITEA